ncbi:MAG: 3-phosphoglycerate dehydrogenase [Ruminococcaceae bacterium]|jgi:D-3-phosphoglycerate dehydrogenase|nr:3-phosphoglycerate dehydrogenase [Oscillospiraceae bacterium]
MFKIQTLNKIAKCGLDNFDEKYEISDTVENPDGIILRSFKMHDMKVGDNLKAVARAGAGTNNIPVDEYAKKGIVVFNTPGANANAVKELTIAGLFLASRKVTEAVDWAKTLKGNGADVGPMVEKGKSAFAGPEIKGKTLGVIGLGAIGVQVANAAEALGMKVIGYDPFLSVEAAWAINTNIKKSNDINRIFAVSDYVTLHLPLNDNTKGLVNAELLENANDGIRILNFARGELVETKALLEALESGKVASYVTDFPSDEVIGVKNVVAIPHLGASTPESEDNCATMAGKELVDYLENGNITNSVNYPSCSMPRSGDLRITIAHLNKQSMLSQISSIISQHGINIDNMINKSKKDYAYTIIDASGEVKDEDIHAIADIEGVLKVRIIK